MRKKWQYNTKNGHLQSESIDEYPKIKWFHTNNGQNLSSCNYRVVEKLNMDTTVAQFTAAS